MADPVATGARAAAARLGITYGEELSTAVEDALQARRSPVADVQYVDPVSLGSLIVSIATLTWMIYSDLRKKSADAIPEAVQRAVQIEVRRRQIGDGYLHEEVTSLVVHEVLKSIPTAE